MSGPAVIFREIHRLRRYARDLQEQLDRIPRQLKAQQAKVERQEAALREAQEAIRKLKVQTHDKEVSLKTRHGQIAKYEQQLNDVANKKEYDALQSEIANARNNCLQLEEEILNGMTEVEERTAQLPELEKALGQTREDKANFEKDAQGRKADLTAQLNKAREELKGVEVNVPAELRQQYQRIVTAKDADALAAVRDRTCTACHTEITQQSQGDLLRENFVMCKACGRILYLPEDVQRSSDEDD